MSERPASSKSADAYRTISEVADDLGLPQHVLRFWETRFPQVKPLKRAGGRRFYRPGDVELLRAVKTLLYDDGYTIKGVQRMLRDQGPRSMTALAAASPTAVPDARDGTAAQAGDPSGVFPEDELGGPPLLPRTIETAIDRCVSTATQTAEDTAPELVTRLEAILAELVECERLVRRATPV